MLGNAAVIRAVARARAAHLPGPLVVDPVAVATTGAVLLDEDGIPALREDLLPVADLVTPNLAEAAALTGVAAISDRDGMLAAAETILGWGPGAVLVKGGHLPGAGAPDLLLTGTDGPRWLEGPRLPGRHTHGTGCVLSAAITARLARGETIAAAAAAAKDYVARAIAAGLELGSGAGPVNPAG
jgi:hydroxymethylpyrimidine/phosphomethylpyrimidine kinase